jgi:DNA polymerase-4
VTRDQTVDTPTDQAATIRQVAGLCLKRVDLKPRLRLLGVRVGSLVKQGTDSPTAQHYSERIDSEPPQVKDHGQTQLLFPLD